MFRYKNRDKSLFKPPPKPEPKIEKVIEENKPSVKVGGAVGKIDIDKKTVDIPKIRNNDKLKKFIEINL